METANNTTTRGAELCRACGQRFPLGTSICPVDGGELFVQPIDPLIGTTLPRHYRFISLIGKGAMSVVYKGLHEPMNNYVAIKLLKSHLVNDEKTHKRFQQESRTAGSLEHPNIVGVLDFGLTDQAVPYLIMELLEGHSLAEIIERGPLRPERAVALFIQGADALAYTHARGVIHRDIKPSNMVVEPGRSGEGEVLKVVDFGIAKIMSSDGGSGLNLTNTGECFGTPLYVSPEQAMGKTLDERADIYSLGCVMYEALCGRPVYTGDTALDIIRKQVTEEPKPLHEANPSVCLSQQLSSIVMKALNKDRNLRYQTMNELKEDLQNLQLDLSNETLQLPKQSQTLAALPNSAPQKHRTGKPSLLPIVLPMVLSVVLLGGAATFVMTGKKSDVTSTGPRSVVGAMPYQEHADQLQQAALLYQKAKACLAADDYLSARENSEKALTICRHYDKSGYLTAETTAQLALIELEMDNVARSKQLARQALQIFGKLPAADKEQTVLVLQGLAELEARQNNLTLAQTFFQKELALQISLYGADDQRLADTYRDLGKTYQRQSKDQEALACYQKAINIAKRVHPDSVEVADTLLLIGTLYYQLNDHINAKTYLEESLATFIKSCGEYSQKTSGAVNCLAKYYEKEKQFDRAEEFYRRAIAISEQVFPRKSAIMERRLTEVVAFFRKQHKTVDATYFEKKLKASR